MDKKQEFRRRILATFKIEAQENISAIAAYLIELENEPGDTRKEELFEVLYRAAHSLKGASRAVGFSDIERICHASEDLLSAIRDQEIDFTPQAFDALFQTSDLIEEVLNSIEQNNEEGSPEMDDKISKHIEVLSMLEAGIEVENNFTRKTVPTAKVEETPTEAPKIKKISVEETLNTKETATKKKEAPQKKQEEVAKPKKEDKEPTKSTADDSIRVSSVKLDKLLVQAEEMLSLKLMADQRLKNIQKILRNLNDWDKKSAELHTTLTTIKQSAGNTNASAEIDKIADFCEWTSEHIGNIEKQLNDTFNLSSKERYLTGLKVDALLEDVKELITIPFSTLLNGFPKMIRDISKELEKKVKFVTTGDSIEIDRRILEQMKNPLIHILRNAIDYGIESPEERLKNNKPEKGEISIRIEQLENNKVEVLVSDDGGGIDLQKLKQQYLKNEGDENGIAPEISDEELLKYIFRSGVSTSAIVTDLSGRGLGMAIAQETIEQLGGTIKVETEKGKSTSFRINLPLSIVTYRGVIVEVENRPFIVPTQKVHSVHKVALSEIETVGNKATFKLNNQIIPLFKLNEVLELNSTQISSDSIQVIVFEINGKRKGFSIDKVIGEQEVLVKKFNKQLSRVRNILGASVLGSGQVVPILNISDLYKSSEKHGATVKTASPSSEKETQRSILIVEDSITSRTLLKNILETSGFKVNVAVDGIDGFTKLKEGVYDAVVTDVEMPRMNGFDLTKKIRSDKETANIPVVLVTSLSKREHREKGIDAGANAYIVKSDFEQSNLMEVLDRLIV